MASSRGNRIIVFCAACVQSKSKLWKQENSTHSNDDKSFTKWLSAWGWWWWWFPGHARCSVGGRMERKKEKGLRITRVNRKAKSLIPSVCERKRTLPSKHVNNDGNWSWRWKWHFDATLSLSILSTAWCIEWKEGRNPHTHSEFAQHQQFCLSIFVPKDYNAWIKTLKILHSLFLSEKGERKGKMHANDSWEKEERDDVERVFQKRELCDKRRRQNWKII